jgi:hypothetical protein
MRPGISRVLCLTAPGAALALLGLTGAAALAGAARVAGTAASPPSAALPVLAAV